MHRRKLLLALAGAAFMAGAPVPSVLAAGGHDHGHGSAPPARLTLDEGRKWPTDEALRVGMTRIRAELEGDLAAIHGGREKRSQYLALAAAIEKEVGGIVQNCRLEPDADAMLHRLLADLLAGVEGMKGRQKSMSRQQGAVRIVQALGDYGTYFDHPGWKPLGVSPSSAGGP